MKIAWIVMAASVSVALVAADPALARPKHKATTVSQCHPTPVRSWFSLFEFREEPRPNGCAPAVYQFGKFIGQDPDPSIRQQLLRDPATGYSAVNN